MNIYKVKQMYDTSKALDCEVKLFKHGIKSREEAQDIAKCVSESINLPFKEHKSRSVKDSGWFFIEENDFYFGAYYEYSQAEKEMYKPRVTV